MNYRVVTIGGFRATYKSGLTHSMTISQNVTTVLGLMKGREIGGNVTRPSGGER
jgi:hypothetical protein